MRWEKALTEALRESQSQALLGKGRKSSRRMIKNNKNSETKTKQLPMKPMVVTEKLPMKTMLATTPRFLRS